MAGALTHDPITVGGGLHQTPTGDVQAGPDGVARALTASQVAEVSSVLDGRRTNNSLLVIGGDHPYAQWWGNDGTDGMAQMYEDLGITPYIATCADESTMAASCVLNSNGGRPCARACDAPPHSTPQHAATKATNLTTRMAFLSAGVAAVRRATVLP